MDPPETYSRTSIALHWTLALLILAAFGVGLTMVDLPVSPQKLRVFAYHKWIGITVLALALVRLAWRATHAIPLPLPQPRWQRLAAQAIHGLLYLLIVAVPLAGWLYTSAAGYPVVYLKIWQIPDLVGKDAELAKILKVIHWSVAWCLIVLVALHAAAALKHHFVDRDATLRRMLAWRRA